MARDVAAQLYPGLPVHPLVQNGCLAAWIAGSVYDADRARAAEIYHNRQERRALLQQPLPTPDSFANEGAYYRHFRRLLSVAAADDTRMQQHRCLFNQEVEWSSGLQGPRLSFYPAAASTVLFSEQERVRISNPSLVRESEDEEEPISWVAAGVVVSVGPPVVVALSFCNVPGGLPAVDYAITTGYHISPKPLSINFDRLQSALFAFCSD